MNTKQHGGARPNSGRKKQAQVNPDKKQVLAVRLPPWLLAELPITDRAGIVERALIAHLKISPPSK